MRIENLVNTEYATALKEALLLRRSGRIDGATDNQLGVFVYNIASWGIAERVNAGKLPEEYKFDDDIRGDVVAMIMPKIDSVDLERSPREIISYLARCASTAAKDLRKKETRKKRQHEDVELEAVVMVSDFYGRPTGQCAYCMELERDKER